ncbi:hypothetical protein [Pulveribacter suum]|uniref:hypothetical protein n=1 Tax=Pulveribacter suum TaxID=2116657 RepID=UPI0013007F9D|nr:hypothetical protein [Pulveribacter suum]
MKEASLQQSGDSWEYQIFKIIQSRPAMGGFSFSASPFIPGRQRMAPWRETETEGEVGFAPK